MILVLSTVSSQWCWSSRALAIVSLTVRTNKEHFLNISYSQSSAKFFKPMIHFTLHSSPTRTTNDTKAQRG